MTFIVHGASGAQGGPVLAALQAAGRSATAAVRDPSRVAGQAVGVDLTSVDSLLEPYASAEGVFVHLPVGPPDLQLQAARAVAEAVARTRPARVVLSTSGYATGTGDPTDSAHDHLAAALAASGTSYAVVEPRLFLENLLLPTVSAGVEDQGVLRYPLREDYAVSWSSHLDVADVVVRLLLDPTVTGVVSVGALPGLLGADLAAGFGRAHGREITFAAQDPEEFGRTIVPLFGEAAARPVVDSYAWRALQPGDVIPEETSAQRLLGLSPRTVEEWLRDVLG